MMVNEVVNKLVELMDSLGFIESFIDGWCWNDDWWLCTPGWHNYGEMMVLMKAQGWFWKHESIIIVLSSWLHDGYSWLMMFNILMLEQWWDHMTVQRAYRVMRNYNRWKPRAVAAGKNRNRQNWTVNILKVGSMWALPAGPSAVCSHGWGWVPTNPIKLLGEHGKFLMAVLAKLRRTKSHEGKS